MIFVSYDYIKKKNICMKKIDQRLLPLQAPSETYLAQSASF